MGEVGKSGKYPDFPLGVMKMMSPKIVIIVVENPDEREKSIRYLLDNNLSDEVVVISSEAEALQYLSRRISNGGRSLTGDIFILDPNAPKTEQWDALRYLHWEHPYQFFTVLVLLLSSQAEETSGEGEISSLSFSIRLKRFLQQAQELGALPFSLNQKRF